MDNYGIYYMGSMVWGYLGMLHQYGNQMENEMRDCIEAIVLTYCGGSGGLASKV